MKKTNRRLSFTIAILFLLICFSNLCFIFAVDTAAESKDIYSEEKVYSKATLEDDFADNRILVVLKNGASLDFKEHNTLDFSDIDCKSVRSMSTGRETAVKAEVAVLAEMAKTDILHKSIKNIAREENSDIDLLSYHKIMCLELAEPGKENVLSAIKILEQRDDIIVACPDYYISYQSNETSDINTLSANDLPPVNWGFQMAKISEAWGITTGSSSVSVGIIDYAVDDSHPELSDVVNLEKSKDFPEYFPEYIENIGLNDPSVEQYSSGTLSHGTHVAGIIAAKGINDFGFSGVCKNVEIVSLNIRVNGNQANLSYAIDAINYAECENIDILNYSNGTMVYTTYDAAYVGLLKSAISNYTGLFVTSAGNNSFDLDELNHKYIPAVFDLPNLIVVGAIDYSKNISRISNYGKKSVDIFAPGEDILSCWMKTECDMEEEHPDKAYGHYEYGYHYNDGTSMAAPYVSGVAALLLSVNEHLSASQLKTTIMCNAEKVDSLTDLCESGGMLDAYAAVSNIVTDHRIHSYAYTTHGLHSGHTKRCVECGQSFEEEHKFELYGKDTSGITVIACRCGERSIGGSSTHTLTDNGYEYLNETSHNIIKRCEECDMNVLTVAEDHTFESGVCNKCNYTCTHPFAHLNNGTCKLCGHDVSANCSHEEFQVAGYTNFNDFFHRTINECKKCRLLQDGHNVYHVYNFTTDEESQEDIAVCSECGHKCLHTNKEVEFEYCVDEVIESEDYYTLVYSDQYHMKNIFCNACQGVYYVKEAHNHTSPGNIEDMCSLCGISHNSSFVEEIPKNALDCPRCSQHKYVTVTEEEYFAIMGELPGEPGTEYESILLCLNCHYSEISPFPAHPSVIYVDCAYLGNPMLPYFPDGGIVYWELPDAPEWYPYPSYVTVSTVNFSTGAKFTWTAGVSGARGEFSLASYFFNTDLPTGVYGVSIYMHSDVPAWSDIQTNTVTFRYVDD